MGTSRRDCPLPLPESTGERRFSQSSYAASDRLDLFADATGRLVQAFLDALESGTTPPCHAEDNIRTLALMLAAYESHETNAPVEMTYAPIP